MKLFLASASPRRREILSILDIPFEVLRYPFDERAFEANWEHTHPNITPKELSTALAIAKAEAAYHKLRADEQENFLVLAADTMVVLDHEILGKGETRKKSLAMLGKLSGHTHQVLTSLALMNAKGELKTHGEITEVRFAKLNRQEIEDYVDSEKPFDKAGAYGIQEKAAIFVEGINGDYLNVVGLPLRATHLLLRPYLSKLH